MGGGVLGRCEGAALQCPASRHRCRPPSCSFRVLPGARPLEGFALEGNFSFETRDDFADGQPLGRVQHARESEKPVAMVVVVDD
ncbi:unnamed protein product [Lampetra planeri]